MTHLRVRLPKENPLTENKNHPNQNTTEHIMREDSTAEGTDEQKKKQTVVKVKTTSDIFKDTNGKKIRTVLTVGEADVGKSFHVQKFIKQWAEKKNLSFFTWVADKTKAFFGKGEENELGIFPLEVSELNKMKDKNSLVGLLNHGIKETKDFVITEFSNFPVCFVLDGLDKFQLPLDFDTNTTLSDISEPASVDVLLTNLIKGNLLPSALVWITSRPSAFKQLNVEKCVDRVTEIRGKIIMQLDIIVHLCRTYVRQKKSQNTKKKNKLSEKTNVVNIITNMTNNKFFIAENKTNVHNVYLCNFCF